jgi:hypothetical protein
MRTCRPHRRVSGRPCPTSVNFDNFRAPVTVASRSWPPNAGVERLSSAFLTMGTWLHASGTLPRSRGPIQWACARTRRHESRPPGVALLAAQTTTKIISVDSSLKAGPPGPALRTRLSGGIRAPHSWTRVYPIIATVSSDPARIRSSLAQQWVGLFLCALPAMRPRMAHRASGRDGANLQRSSPMQRRMRFTLSLPRARLGTKGQGVHPR